MAPTINDIVVCEWRDAHASVKEEFSMEEIQSATSYKFKTYGILLRDDRISDIKDPLVAVAAEIGEDGRYRGVSYIPAEMVISVKVVKANRRSESKAKKLPQLAMIHNDEDTPPP